MARFQRRAKARRTKPTRAQQLQLVRAARVKTRAQQGTLRSNLIKPYTGKVYWDSLIYFFNFISYESMPNFIFPTFIIKLSF